MSAYSVKNHQTDKTDGDYCLPLVFPDDRATFVRTAERSLSGNLRLEGMRRPTK